MAKIETIIKNIEELKRNGSSLKNTKRKMIKKYGFFYRHNSQARVDSPKEIKLILNNQIEEIYNKKSQP